MAAILDRATRQQPEWFHSWFDSPHYQQLYAHRDEAEAERFLDGLMAQLKPHPGAPVLDLGCGTGRHSKYLASKGLQVTGLDLAAGSIASARKCQHRLLQFRQHDMRVPFGVNAFDYVFNFFTSFGYFDEPDEHLAVVRNIAASLRPGGRLMLDYFNSRYVAFHLKSDEVKELGGTIYLLQRWTDGRYFFKRIVVVDGIGESREYVERVARFTVADFERMFAMYGLSIETVYGDYALTAYDADASPRMILVARKQRPAPIAFTYETGSFARGSAFPA